MMAPGPASVDPTWTRAQALADLQACTNLASVFAVANRALGAQRQAWGDTLEEAANAAHLWSLTSFPVATAETLDLHANRDFSLSAVQGSQLLACSVAAAKTLAAGLLQPGLTPQDRTTYLNETLPQAVLAIGQEVGLFNAQISARLAPAYARMVMGFDLEQASATPAATQALAQSTLPSWEHLQTLLSPNAEAEQTPIHNQASPAAAQADGHHAASPFRALIEETGFSRVNIGPAGGMAQARASATHALSAARDLARITSLPSHAVGLDGLSLSVNRTFNEIGTRAYFAPSLRQISLTYQSSALGHEWIHAMEDWSDTRAFDAGIMQATDQLRTNLRSITPNADAFQDMANLLQSDRTKLNTLIAQHLSEHGTFLTRLAARRGQLPSGVNMELQHIAAGQQDAYGVERLVKAVAANTGKGRPASPEAAIRELAETAMQSARREQQLRTHLLSGSSFFEAASRDRDLISNTHYWASGDEQLARAGEGLFATANNPHLAVIDVRDPLVPLIPMGSERDQAVHAFQTFYQRVRERLHDKDSLLGRPLGMRKSIAADGETPTKDAVVALHAERLPGIAPHTVLAANPSERSSGQEIDSPLLKQLAARRLTRNPVVPASPDNTKHLKR